MDERLKPYAEYMEKICKGVAEEQPVSCAFVCRNKDGDICTSYFGKADSVFELSQLSFAIQQDALMSTVYANADYIKRQAEEMGNNADQ